MNLEYKKHLHLWGNIGPTVSPIGWVLQQSDSITHQWFRRHIKVYHESLKSKTLSDPWDSRPTYYSHNVKKQQYTNIIESSNRFTTHDLDDFFSQFKGRAVVGLNHGAWNKRCLWNPKDVHNIYISTTDKSITYFFNVYSSRKVNSFVAVLRTIDDHVHDHKLNSDSYKKHIHNVILEKAKYHLKNNIPMEFWQFQHTFHYDNNYFPMYDEKQKILKNTIEDYKKKKTNHNAYLKSTSPYIIEDPFNINLEKTCDLFKIAYNSNMQKEYDMWLTFVDNYV